MEYVIAKISLRSDNVYNTKFEGFVARKVNNLDEWERQVKKSILKKLDEEGSISLYHGATCIKNFETAYSLLNHIKFEKMNENEFITLSKFFSGNDSEVKHGIEIDFLKYKPSNNLVDEYVVYIGNGNIYYYKNKELHRENGPAFIPLYLRAQYTGLGDDQLYKTIYEQPDNSFEIYKFKNPHQAHFFFEGVRYETQKQINAVKLNKEFENEILLTSQKTQQNDKKLKM